MTEPRGRDADETSLFALGTTLLLHRWRIVRWTFMGGAAAALLVFSRPALYLASASFRPQGDEASRSSLASLAGQFGVLLPAGNQSLSPDFYADLLKARVLLRPIARDTFVVPELGGQRVSFADLFQIEESRAERREERAVKLLTNEIVRTSVVNTTGVVKLSVATEWPSVSLAIATALVKEVNDFNRRTSQGEAAAERRFVEDRLAIAGAELREAEDRLEHFLVTNRQFDGSHELIFQHDRLQRDVSLQQQVFTSLTQSYEEVRIREVRDTPVITVIESPSVPTLPESRGRGFRVLLGLLFGGFVGVLVAFTSGMMALHRKHGDVELEEFVGTLGEIRGEVLSPFRWLKDRIRR